MNFWINLSDQLNEGEFVWTGTSSVPSFREWDQGQPTSTNSSPNLVENCVNIIQGSKKWHDSDCSLKLNGICEK